VRHPLLSSSRTTRPQQIRTSKPSTLAQALPALQHACQDMAGCAPPAACYAVLLAEAKAKLKKADAEVDATKCVICMDAQRCTALLPCKHLALCASPECAEMLGAATSQQCPLCREPVMDLLQLYV
jgi:hypothetical protein